MGKTGVIKGEFIEVSFEKDPEIIAEIKRLSGRRWIKKNKMWLVPYNREVVNKLMNLGFSISFK